MSRFFGFWNKETQTFEWLKPETKENVAPYIQTDEIEPTEYLGNANREMFTSYAKLKRRCREDGYEITGGDHLNQKPPEPPKVDPRAMRDMVEKSFMDIKYDRIPKDERSEQIWKQEERNFQAYKQRNWGR